MYICNRAPPYGALYQYAPFKVPCIFTTETFISAKNSNLWRASPVCPLSRVFEIFAKEPCEFAKEPSISTKEPCTCAKEPYLVACCTSWTGMCVSAKEPYISAKEPYISANKLYLMAHFTCFLP